MTKFSLAKASLLALASICASAAVVGCSTSSDKVAADGGTGEVGLNLTIAPGVDINAVTFTVSGNGITPITNTIPVASLGSTVSAAIQGLPAGSGYSVTLSAVSVDGKTNCAGSATFSVVAGQTTSVSIPLDCRGPVTTGGATIGGVVNNCPTIGNVVVFPLQVKAGDSISVSSSATDKDGGNMLTTAWTATAGSFLSASSPSTSYKCEVGGPQTLTVTVTDGNPNCNDTTKVTVNCLPGGTCGNKIIELGEQCDDGNAVSGDGCSSQCLHEVLCGDNLKEGTEECDDGNKVDGDACSNACTINKCGNNRVDTASGEQCDPPNGTTCDTQCKAIGVVCGNGIKQGNEACDDGNTVNGDGCENDCTITPDPCLTCLGANCKSFADACTAATGNAAAGPAAGQPKATLCQAMIDCSNTTKCAKGSLGSGEGCYCGTAGTTDCISGLADGQCKSQAEKAAESTSGLTVGQRWVNPGYAMGFAGTYIRCSLQSCNTQCGLQ